MKAVFSLFIFIITYCGYSQYGAYKQLSRPEDNLSNDIQYRNIPFCSDLKISVLNNGKLEATMGDSQMNSSFLEAIHFFNYYGSTYILVELKESRQTYLFCNIPAYDLDNFLASSNPSYGERFNKYIMPHKCNCK